MAKRSSRRLFAVYKRYDGCCAYCGCDCILQETKEQRAEMSLFHFWNATVDHIYPKSLGGQNNNDGSNHALACLSCNIMKRDWTVGEMLIMAFVMDRAMETPAPAAEIGC